MINEKNAARLAADFLRTIEDCPDSGQFSGRGIVTCAGGIRYNTCAWVLIKMLRHLGCELPIEVWHLNEEERLDDWIKLVEPLGVRCLGAERPNTHGDSSRWDGWALKSHAVLHSAFEEVFFLDADNVPVVDPTFLFDEPPYRETGAVFWPDGGRMPRESACWKIFDVPYRDESDQESGQLLLDKRRCWPALQLCDWYNQHADFYYQYIYGDKDTFRFAWHRTEQPYAMPDRKMHYFRGTLYQHDFQGRCIFQHRSHHKWSLVNNRRTPGFQWEEECLNYVQRLKQLWSPIRQLSAAASAQDRERQSQLVGTQFDFVHQGRFRSTVQLLPQGAIGGGALRDHVYWWVEDECLVFAAQDGSPTCRLQQDSSGDWKSIWHKRPETKIQLLSLLTELPL